MRALVFAAVLLSLGLSTNCASSRVVGPGESAGRALDDAAMTASVNGLIVGDADARFFRIDVSTSQGAVTLRGTIPSRSAESRLVSKINTLRGVRSVTSLLRIAPAAS